MSPPSPDPDLLRAFRRAVHGHFERELADERERSEALRATVLRDVRVGLERARTEGLCGAAWLFGSYAWGQPGERSDVDLLVEEAADPLMVASVVGRACGRDVHVIAMSEAPATLKQRVREDGVSL